MTDEPCPRCKADPQPPNFAPRGCAFRSGVFDEAAAERNWNCATISRLWEVVEDRWFHDHREGDESIQVTRAADDDGNWNGWIVLTRYKHRGQTSSAMHMGDWWPPRPVTLALVEQTIALHEQIDRERAVLARGGHDGR